MATIVVTTSGQIVTVTNNDTVIIDIPGGGEVTIVADPSVKVKKFAVQFVNDTEADTVKIDLHTFSEKNLHIDIWDYDPSDTVQLLGGFNKQVDPQHPDLFDFSYVGSTGATFTGEVRARDHGENNFNTLPQPVIICFAEDSIIDTDLGPRRIETLREGDLVVTQDNGLQPVRWIGRRALDSLDLARHPQLLPVRIAAGAMGGGLPICDLTLSPQHRVQVADWRAEMLFGTAQVLVAVKHLVDGAGITVVDDAPAVTYYHLLFDRHEIIRANGLWSESLHLGDMALEALPDEARAEIDLLFPDAPLAARTRGTAAMVLRGFEAAALRVA